MSTSIENYAEVKSALKEALIELLQERRELFHNIFKEVIQEVGLTETKIPTFASHTQSTENDDFEKAVEREIEAFHELHPTLLKQYPGEFVAIHEQQVVDHDAEKLALYQRIHDTYPDQFVLMRRIENDPEPELRFRSTRFFIHSS